MVKLCFAGQSEAESRKAPLAANAAKIASRGHYANNSGSSCSQDDSSPSTTSANYYETVYLVSNLMNDPATADLPSSEPDPPIPG